MVLPPHPHSQRQQKSRARGQTKIGKRHMLDNFYHFYERSQQQKLPAGLKRCPHKNYSGRFPEGGKKEEIQQWRQARSRSGEKETLNIMLRKKS